MVKRKSVVWRICSTAGKIAEEILTHLAGLPGAKVRVTLAIEAELPEGAPDHVVRTNEALALLREAEAEPDRMLRAFLDARRAQWVQRHLSSGRGR